jgi:dipeptidyl-peptidase-4
VTSTTEGRPSYPQQRSRTRNFSAGVPRAFQVDPTGSRVLFLRSPAGDDPVAGLWLYEVATGEERQLVDPRALLTTGSEDLPAAERARRERLREIGAGIVAFATDDAHDSAGFTLSGRLYVVDIESGAATEVPVAGAVVDPRLDPSGQQIAYVTDGALHVVSGAGADTLLASDPDPAVTWGLAEFVAAEEMHRYRGYWWAPDGARLLVARVDENPVQRWHISDPANPDREPQVVRYPRAGTPNADVSLWVIDLSGARTQVEWDRSAFPYLVDVQATESGALVAVQSRNQRLLQALDVDLTTGSTQVVHEETDDKWVDIVGGVPRRLRDGRLVTTSYVDDVRRLLVEGEPVSPVGWQVGSVNVGAEHVLFSATDDPTQRHIWRYDVSGDVRRLTNEPGMHAVAYGGGVHVLASASMDHHGTRFTVHKGDEQVGAIASYAEEPVLTPNVTFLTSGSRELRSALILPSGHERGVRLPVLVDPYGGPLPETGRVTRNRAAHLTSQWFAEQGYAVVVTDGRGMPGRGHQWSRAICDDWSTAVLDDQVDALHAIAETVPDMDLTRVGIRGWSFGGYLAALAVLRRPDVFHAGIAGAPVTDWTLYDTHYTERYLGDPNDDVQRYAAASLIDDAPRLTRPLLLIHGLADDNVVAAHTLQLSAALLAAGRPHSVLPLPGITHMTATGTVEENLLRLQVEFLDRELNREASPESSG